MNVFAQLSRFLTSCRFGVFQQVSPIGPDAVEQYEGRRHFAKIEDLRSPSSQDKQSRLSSIASQSTETSSETLETLLKNIHPLVRLKGAAMVMREILMRYDPGFAHKATQQINTTIPAGDTRENMVFSNKQKGAFANAVDDVIRQLKAHQQETGQSAENVICALEKQRDDVLMQI